MLRADLFSALADVLREAGKGGEVVYVGADLPLGGDSTVVSRFVRTSSTAPGSAPGPTGTPIRSANPVGTEVGFPHVRRRGLRFERTLSALRKSGATFRGVSFEGLPDDGIRVLAKESGGTVWILGPNAQLPGEALDRLCR